MQESNFWLLFCCFLLVAFSPLLELYYPAILATVGKVCLGLTVRNRRRAHTSNRHYIH